MSEMYLILNIKLKEREFSKGWILPKHNILWNIFLFQRHRMSLMNFMVSPPGCGRSVTDFCGWDAHEAQLRCPDEVDGDTWLVSGGALT
jgi:hypothetical protein